MASYQYKIINIFGGDVRTNLIDIKLINKWAKEGWRVVFVDDTNKVMTNKEIVCLLEKAAK